MKTSRLWPPLIALAIILLMPIVLYVARFGGGLSDKHVHWSEFGAYVGGIYAPIAALFTLLIIARQFSSQVKFNKHQIDQAFLSNSRSDLHYYLDQLHQITSKREPSTDIPLSYILIDYFGSHSHEGLRARAHEEAVRRIRMADDRLTALWGAVYTVFQGLRCVQETDYELVYSSSKQKCIATLGYALCDALDNFHYVAASYPDDFAYEFHAGMRPEY